MNFKEHLDKRVSRIEAVLAKYLPQEGGPAGVVLEAMNYSVNAGGKRLRPMLMQEAFVLCGGSGELVEPFMAALEMIHTYSLVHDDLPAMDNDEYRRGRKTTHVVYGETMAILAGDALLNYAFETACRAFAMKPGCAQTERAIGVLAEKAGIFGMIGGQTADILAENAEGAADMPQLLFIHEKKTAALIQAALMIGAILAGAEQEVVDLLEKVGYDVGVAFQIQDDILDVTGEMAELGKPIGSDEKNHKTTYVTLAGVDEAKKEVERLSNEAVSILEAFETRNEFLEELIRELITRRK
ncbi:MAG: polyprenyl synthetase family protein [Lachnospiraceae bacterium]|nr:polyprenyl synthetase family protein [Lachnospiraceae bacterium]